MQTQLTAQGVRIDALAEQLNEQGVQTDALAEQLNAQGHQLNARIDVQRAAVECTNRCIGRAVECPGSTNIGATASTSMSSQ
jgi:hypothetical protein